MKYSIYNSPIGKLTLKEENGALIAIHFGEEKIRDQDQEMTTVLQKAVDQLEEYFQGLRKDFDIPLHLEGTYFQVEAWKALQKIPYGEKRSYKEQAELIQNPKAVRAIGGANNKNRLPIVIPCHRVVGANGSLVGYAGGLEIKKYLLNLESNNA